MRLGEVLVDDDLFDAAGLGHAARPACKRLSTGSAAFGQRNELRRSRAARKFGMSSSASLAMRASTAATPGISAICATSVFGARLTTAKDIGKLIAFIIGGAGFFERSVGTDRHHQRGHPAGNHERDGQHLGPEPPRSRNSLRSSTRMGSPVQRGGGAARFVLVDSRDLTIREEQNAMRNVLNAGVMGDDQRRGAELRIDAQQRLDHPDAGLGIRARRSARRTAAPRAAWRWRARWRHAAARRPKAATGK